MSHPEAQDPLGEALLTLARDAISARFGGCARPLPTLPELDDPGACFATLTNRNQGDLRGCIGSLVPYRPLRHDVRENAIAAAFRDPRFSPLEQSELAAIRVEVSLLTRPEPIPVTGEDHARLCLRPGADGVIFSCGARRATFLPQVWESLPSPALFLARLKEKAGFAADFWSPEVKLERYAVRKWRES